LNNTVPQLTDLLFHGVNKDDKTGSLLPATVQQMVISL